MNGYKDGKLNVFGFDKNRHYGYAPDYTNRPMRFEEALRFAGIDDLDIPIEVRRRWKRNGRKAGFTVVVGNRPHKFRGRATVESILQKLRYHPQARRLLSHKKVIAVRKGQTWGQRLEAPTVDPKPGFELPRQIKVPAVLSHRGEKVRLTGRGRSAGTLILHTSAVPMARGSELAAMNTIDVVGEIGCIGSYRMNELGYLKNYAESEFIYGECKCPVLESPELNAVSNDREKLVSNDATDALIEWIRERVDELAGEMAEKTQQERKSHDLRQSSLFNQILNKWKNKFMAKLAADLFGGTGLGGTFGGSGGGGSDPVGDGGAGDGGNGDKRAGDDDEEGGGAGDEKRRGTRFPLVLLSGHNLDPLDDSATEPYYVDPRQPPIYQRPKDIEHGIYWINTARPLAEKIMETYGAHSPRWREYLFQRYVDIILKQTVYEVAKHDADFTPDKVDGLIDDITSRVHDAAADDLETFLFHETMTGMAAKP